MYILIVISSSISEMIRIDYENKVEIQKEELLALNDSLTDINATKDRLFSIIAHDLKNPIGSLDSFVNMFVHNYKTYEKS